MQCAYNTGNIIGFRRFIWLTYWENSFGSFRIADLAATFGTLY